ncbi:MAG: hypothetical protein IT289_10335 [Oligoflexia bacterium]|nr:hypothetical protein [Oligoflexia bacterium]
MFRILFTLCLLTAFSTGCVLDRAEKLAKELNVSVRGDVLSPCAQNQIYYLVRDFDRLSEEEQNSFKQAVAASGVTEIEFVKPTQTQVIDGTIVSLWYGYKNSQGNMDLTTSKVISDSGDRKGEPPSYKIGREGSKIQVVSTFALNSAVKREYVTTSITTYDIIDKYETTLFRKNQQDGNIEILRETAKVTNDCANPVGLRDFFQVR